MFYSKDLSGCERTREESVNVLCILTILLRLKGIKTTQTNKKSRIQATLGPLVCV